MRSSAAPLGSRTVRVICQRLLQPSEPFRRRSLIFDMAALPAMTLPTRQEINPYDDLDGRVACEHFLGKSLNEAEALFRSEEHTSELQSLV